jgi:hypothetical protein
VGAFMGVRVGFFPIHFAQKTTNLSCSNFSFPPTIRQETETGKDSWSHVPYILLLPRVLGFFRVLFFWHLINADIVGFEEMIKSCSCCQPHGSNVNLFIMKTAFTLLNKDC